jgi:hypothetical protein
MPYAYFTSLSYTDLHAIVSYLHSIPTVRHALPGNPPSQQILGKRAVLMDAINIDKNNLHATHGEFLVRIAGCETCHTPMRDGQFIRSLAFAGGTVFRHGKEIAASANLTPDSSGISYYDEKQFVQVMRTGHVGARPLMSAMPWMFYGKMSTEDLGDIFQYLKSIPPVIHHLDNSEPPSLCRLCGNRHGFGSRN